MDGEFFLVRRMKGGEEAAMEQFVRKYYDPILSYCCHHTTVYGLAEDLTQETFERFFSISAHLPAYGKTGELPVRDRGESVPGCGKKETGASDGRNPGGCRRSL